MKKGFTMIELIFVIVILGILASVAIPRLAGTKADAEISAAVANLRTLVSDANVYYVAKGEFPAGVTWNQITNVPVNTPGNDLTANTSLNIGGQRCIDFAVTKETNTAPAYIKFAKFANGATNSAVCREVQNSESLRSYFTSRVPNVAANGDDAAKGYIAIGSNVKLVR